jgi:hypothetical protein
LADGHARVNSNRQFDGHLQCPVVAKTRVAFAGRRVNVDPESPDTGLPLEKRNESMGLGIFLRDAQVELSRYEDVPAFGNPNLFDQIRPLRIECPVSINGQVRPQMDVVGIGSQAIGTVRSNDDPASFHLLSNLGIT